MVKERNKKLEEARKAINKLVMQNRNLSDELKKTKENLGTTGMAGKK